MDSVVAALHRTTDDADVKAVLLCQKGDTDAFEVLVERHQKRMLNVAYRMLGDDEEACDVVQEAFLAAYRAIRSFRRESKFFHLELYGDRRESRTEPDRAGAGPVAARNTLHRRPRRNEMDGSLQRLSAPDCGGNRPMNGWKKWKSKPGCRKCIRTLETEYREGPGPAGTSRGFPTTRSASC